jgi:hypothetical protein
MSVAVKVSDFKSHRVDLLASEPRWLVPEAFEPVNGCDERRGYNSPRWMCVSSVVLFACSCCCSAEWETMVLLRLAPSNEEQHQQLLANCLLSVKLKLGSRKLSIGGKNI